MAEIDRCWYEKCAQTIGIDFISIKGNNLVFNPNTVKDAIGPNFSSSMIRGVCKYVCHLCKPKISGNKKDGFRIERKNYHFEERNEPLAKFEHFSPSEPIKGVRIALVDDSEFLDATALRLSREFGYEVLYALINPNVKVSEIAFKTLCEKIISWDTNWLISDKGLGHLDGIRFIKTLRDGGINTIMYTGEIQTDVTRRIAKYFVEKPVPAEHFAELIENDR